MAEEWQPAKEETEQKPVEVQEEQPEPSPGMTAFLKDTKELWEKLQPKEEPPPEEPKEEVKAPPPPRIQESAVPKEDTFIPQDEWESLDPKVRKRMERLYAQTKENERQWAEAKEILRKYREDAESLRGELAKLKITSSEAELDGLQAKVIELFTPNSPNYNPTEGTRLLKELTSKDVQIKAEKEAETKRTEEFRTQLDQESHTQTIKETATILDTWAGTRDYAQEGHPLYPHVVKWLRDAYQTAPEHVTVQQIVNKAQQVFDSYVEQHPEFSGKKPNGSAEPAPKPAAPGQGMTVSHVIGTQQRAPQAPVNAAEKLNSRQREIAKKLGVSPEDYLANMG